ncbi:nitrate reductase molybdenum cofactor assembly chaperone [Eleftheria terrae]|uniref:nitrate reductase molybdenum cofactor assembly chaperone n=1 Tax=Eleftheria terrae TaxID=1597781 RepID=UPI00263B07FD|nr:nitrate reductase molybdenum cofactor assembly chaperone [Eleftheria terrae]WKB54813.1 nitrate reductase molybdenum cofactor assembly chaperone [Eleftheria terrae]
MTPDAVASPAPQRATWRLLARLLCYPDAALREALPELGRRLAAEAALDTAHRDALQALVDELASGEALDIEAAYVELFDRGRATSLHLFEHVHGESRDRGAAMIDLGRLYAEAGLDLGAGELPDYLPAALEFASTQSPEIAAGFVGEFAHILNALHAALAARDSRYAAVVAAVLALAGQVVEPQAVQREEALDAAWEEPVAFGGCSSQGQSRPGTPQPVHFVRPAARAVGPVPGV